MAGYAGIILFYLTCMNVQRSLRGRLDLEMTF